MCIIGVLYNRRPSTEELNNCIFENSHGAGLAWIEKNHVRWTKGLKTINEVQKALSQIPLPAIFHARTASAGSVLPELCHPFPLEPDIPLATSGKTSKGVLFHNGHWSGWEIACNLLAETNGWPLLKGPASDTRYIAWLVVNAKNASILKKLEAKIVILSPKGPVIFGDGWIKDRGVLWSNYGYKGGAYQWAKERWNLLSGGKGFWK